MLEFVQMPYSLISGGGGIFIKLFVRDLKETVYGA